MKVSLDEIKQAFNSLIEGKKPREELSNWAQKLLFAEDDGNLKYDPPSEEARIWNSIKYLIGVDLKDFDGNYLHSKENFIQYKKDKHL